MGKLAESRYACRMCGRFVQSITWRELHELLAGLTGAPVELKPRYNLAPGQDATVIRAGAEGFQLDLLHWGLIPPWARDPAIAFKLINARVETAAEKPSFRNSWRARRCLIPANGYYEWTSVGGIRQPWLIRRRDEAPLFLAGLWENWRITEPASLHGRFAGRQVGEQVETFTILTTAANEDVEAINHRMPVLLHPHQFESWLTDAPAVPAAEQPGQLTTQTVDVRVNDPRNDDPDCLLPSLSLL
ncbi:MAG: SOS response-associated peptidase [Gammaproteobacteria bacterium]|nr:SOS response-associated peptidase [Gammaproteobacteria bacterium]MYF00082.1 SOS response-associated peptidase [Gammaproteobacteria bacterium]MYG96589.1 SOS response-associated peptidase [Gammaproteobacteria bacterium]